VGVVLLAAVLWTSLRALQAEPEPRRRDPLAEYVRDSYAELERALPLIPPDAVVGLVDTTATGPNRKRQRYSLVRYTFMPRLVVEGSDGADFILVVEPEERRAPTAGRRVGDRFPVLTWKSLGRFGNEFVLLKRRAE
jgi:hypothetical protein